ncbi:U3 small nucleolar ribonucleoprotein IMP3 [Nematocida sp. AWRm80]|nr:U3 small nucleolar ribonucleoprotein IMP3 [Nematocida sp. AWRm80]
MRVLKYHEQRLLKKVNLLEWKGTSTGKEQAITRKYMLEDRETYIKYNLVVGKIKRLTLALAKLNDNDELKELMTKELTNKLYSLGIINSKRLIECSKVGVGSFCRRRLSSILVSIKLVPDIQTAVTLISHGHIKLGTQTTTDSSIIISRAIEDYITWRDESKIKQAIEKFNDK